MQPPRIISARPKTKRHCVYCDKRVIKSPRGEHIIPDALGGKLTISEVCHDRSVCRECNNGVLAELDQHLCSRSPLSIVAGYELNGFVWQRWEVDQGANNLLIEVRTDAASDSLIPVPQIIFDEAGPQLRGDTAEIQSFGVQRFEAVFLERLFEALQNDKESVKRRFLHPKVVSKNEFLSHYRYPPRMFARKPIHEFESGMSFEFQYVTAADRKRALNVLENWDNAKSFRSGWSRFGPELPVARISFDTRLVVRGLVKLGLNLIAAFCPRTPVTPVTFPGAIELVLGSTPVPDSRLLDSGFVVADDVRFLPCPPRSHAFRLVSLEGDWHVYSSFFGGRIGSVVRFPGPNFEEWTYADVVMPLDSREIPVLKTGQLIYPMPVRVEWVDLTRIIPSVPIRNLKTELTTAENACRPVQ